MKNSLFHAPRYQIVLFFAFGIVSLNLIFYTVPVYYLTACSTKSHPLFTVSFLWLSFKWETSSLHRDCGRMGVIEILAAQSHKEG